MPVSQAGGSPSELHQHPTRIAPFNALGAVFRRARFTTAVEQAIRVMAFNRLCDPESKLGVLRWLQTVSMPGIDVAKLSHQHLLRSMDALMDHQQAVDDCVAQLLRPLIDEDLSVVFYDLTTIRAEGHSQQDGDVRHFGMSKEGVIARQFMLGVVQTADGMPIYHEVFDGNTAEAPTLEPTLKKVLARYPHIRRLIVVADRGLLSLDNIEALTKLHVAGDRALEFILAVPGRRYGEFVDLLAPMSARMAQATDEVVEEAQWQGHRLVVAHNPVRATEQTQERLARIHALEERAAQWASKLDAQDAGQVHRGRKLSDSGAKARLFHEVSDAHLARIIQVDLKSDLFAYEIDDAALARAQLMDGKLMLITNVRDMTANEVVRRYKSLADIERGFKVLKSEIEIAPVFHRLPERIRAHASICFMALILYRVMRQRLKLAGSELSPEAALADLRRIQRHTVTIDRSAPIHGVSTVQPRQAAALSALNVKKPTIDAQMPLL
jgi:transposase